MASISPGCAPSLRRALQLRASASQPGGAARSDGSPAPASPAEPAAEPPDDRSLGVYALPLLNAEDASAPAGAAADAPEGGATADASVPKTPADAGPPDAGAAPDATEPAAEQATEPAEDPPLEGLELGLTQCGRITCNPGYECCCEVCVPRSEGCNDPNCPASSSLSLSVPCGMMLCDPGDICCDPSCGACGTAGECPENPCE